MFTLFDESTKESKAEGKEEGKAHIFPNQEIMCFYNLRKRGVPLSGTRHARCGFW